ncbi:hypothetical protein LINPERPRIM_LOCUS14531, partial [Linum perenne]
DEEPSSSKDVKGKKVKKFKAEDKFGKGKQVLKRKQEVLLKILRLISRNQLKS